MSDLNADLARLAESFGRYEAERHWCQANKHRNVRLAVVGGQCGDKASRSRDALEKRVTAALSVDGRSVPIGQLRDALAAWLEYGRQSVDADAVARNMEERLAERLPAWQAADDALIPPDGGG